jgi:3-hydroxybutyryl-CoA dehydrogenase
MDDRATRSIQRVCVFGAGFMGYQIALQCAIHDVEVCMVDVSATALHQALGEQRNELDKPAYEDKRREVCSRIHTATCMEEAGPDFDLVIESVPERLALKREVFAELDKVCPPHTILATNSSSLRISAIEDATNRPGQVLNMHFFMPVWERPIVELMGGAATTDETVRRMFEFSESVGLLPLVVRKESTGFIFNRVWRAIKKECLKVVDEGVASVEDVDRAWMVVMGQEAGPFGVMDRVGLDVVHDIEMNYYLESGSEDDAPPKVLVNKVARNELGVKTGCGFYDYPDPAYEEPGFLRCKPQKHDSGGV